jgi:hypothetical protein
VLVVTLQASQGRRKSLDQTLQAGPVDLAEAVAADSAVVPAAVSVFFSAGAVVGLPVP